MSDSLLVCPGGFLHSAVSVAGKTFEERKERLEATPVIRSIIRMVGDGTVVTGMDRIVSGKREQFMVAVDKNGVQAVSRKLFPTKGESLNEGLDTHLSDASDSGRFFTMPDGRTAVLLTCYDVFSVGDWKTGSKARLTWVRDIKPEGTKRQNILENWKTLLDVHQPTVGFVGIHDFANPNVTVFYQRHGIANAASAMQGEVYGASHFQTLPHNTEAPLSSRNVPASHLKAGSYRQAHFNNPNGFSSGNGWIVRYFD